ncbi:MAG TPA: MFS transporter, partial [Firmicutes bacterium]|nr:MFS transporter [Bacillota bacterium]
TTAQMNVPPDMRGRAMSVYTMLMQGTGPLGNLIAGSLADHLGAGWGFTVGGGVSLLATLATMQWLRRSRPGPQPGPGLV